MPLIVRYPGHVPAGRRVERLVSNVDVFPTLVDYLQIPRAEDARSVSPGRSFAAALRGEALFAEFENVRAIRTRDEVRRLHIAMDDSLGVSVVKPVGDIGERARDTGEPPELSLRSEWRRGVRLTNARQHGRERLAFDELHGVVRSPITDPIARIGYHPSMTRRAEPSRIDALRREIAAIARDQPFALAYLHGSVAAGTSTPLSDVDIALVVSRLLPTRERLRLELGTESKLGNALAGDFDVRVIDDAPLAVKGKVVQDGILLYARDEETRIDFEATVRDRYFDFLPVLRLHQEAYFAAQRPSRDDGGSA